MKVFTLFDKGSIKDIEDELFVFPPFYGVMDGASAPYSKSNPPILFDSLLGGAMAVETIRLVFEHASGKDNLEAIIRAANCVIGAKQKKQGLDLMMPDQLGGAAFVVAKITEENIEIIQAADCFALFCTKSNGLEITKNQVYAANARVDLLTKSLLEKLARKHNMSIAGMDQKTRKELREKMWDEFAPALGLERKHYVNNPKNPRAYGFLNGQESSQQFWFRIKRKRDDVSLLLLFTDGLVPWEWRKEGEETFKETIYALYKRGGLEELLNKAREVEKTMKNTNYIDCAEVAAIAIEA